jgi:hypothetical protein
MRSKAEFVARRPKPLNTDAAACHDQSRYAVAAVLARPTVAGSVACGMNSPWVTTPPYAEILFCH